MPESQPIFDAQGLQGALVRAGARPGPVRVLETVDSTNEELRRWGQVGAGDWALVLAERQTAGRGRRGRRWSSPPGGNLYLSMLPPKPATPSTASRIPLLAAVATAEALEAEGAAVGLKWPNDLLGPSGAKLGGILVEAIGISSPSVIIGVGLNVKVPSGELAEGAASLQEESGGNGDRLRLAARIVAGVQAWWQELSRKGFSPVATAWAQRALWLGQRVRVMCPSQTLVGEMRGIDEQGCLRLATREGERTVANGELSLRLEEGPG